jgi:hypothetical protein
MIRHLLNRPSVFAQFCQLAKADFRSKPLSPVLSGYYRWFDHGMPAGTIFVFYFGFSGSHRINFVLSRSRPLGRALPARETAAVISEKSFVKNQNLKFMGGGSFKRVDVRTANR